LKYRYTLKNRPKVSGLDSILEREHAEPYEEWFEGFEAERRQRIKEAQAMIKKYPEDTVGKAAQLAIIHENKLILGVKEA